MFIYIPPNCYALKRLSPSVLEKWKFFYQIFPNWQLICYDISKNSLRSNLSKKIIAHGLDRINKSVYLGTISSSSLTQLEQLLSSLMKAKAGPNDSLIVISVSIPEVQAMRIYGKNELDKEELSGVKTTLIL